MGGVTITSPVGIDEVTCLKLAREIAMDLHELPQILDRYKISEEDWQELRAHPAFLRYLDSEVAAWQAATNTHERVKLKAAAAVEEWIPELFSRMHVAGESLSAKIEGGKLLARLAGMGLTNANVEGGGEKFQVTINLGADQQIKIEKDVTPKVIDGEVVEET